MIKIKTQIVAIIVLAHLISVAIFACDCPPLPLKDELKRVETVFAAEAIDEKEVHDEFVTKVVTFKVEKIWKGELIKSVEYHMPTSSCAIGFELGKKYLVYGFVKEGRVYTNACSRTIELTHASGDLKELGEFKEP